MIRSIDVPCHIRDAIICVQNDEIGLDGPGLLTTVGVWMAQVWFCQFFIELLFNFHDFLEFLCRFGISKSDLRSDERNFFHFQCVLNRLKTNFLIIINMNEIERSWTYVQVVLLLTKAF